MLTEVGNVRVVPGIAAIAHANRGKESFDRAIDAVMSGNAITEILADVVRGDARAADKLLTLVYDELRRLASQNLSRERAGQTLDATALVHEAYLRLAGADQQWDGRGHFYAAAAESMRRILIEKARHRKRQKHGGKRKRVDLDDAHRAVEPPSDDLLAIDEALTALEQTDSSLASLVKLHFFSGLPLAEVASLLKISERTAYRDWAYARAWLARFLNPPEEKS